MKNYEDIIKALECCADAEAAHCDVCPYHAQNACRQKDKDAVELIKEMKAMIETPKNAGSECTAMPNYEAEYNRLYHENQRLSVDLAEAQKELIFLRAIKAAAEAFLGRKIR